MSEVIVLNEYTPSVIYLCSKDKRFKKLVSMIGEITYVPHDDGYSFLVHEIIEQMLSIKAGAKIYARLEELCDSKISPENISMLTYEELKSIGTSSAKAKYIQRLTQSVITGSLDLSTLPELAGHEVIQRLTFQKGIGNWTAKMYLIFVLDRQDILPYEDVAFLQSYRWLYKTSDSSIASVKKKCSKWKPYSSIAARYLYRALDTGLAKNEFHLYKY